MGMAHYKVILAYDGSGFAGFQRQLNQRTVQGDVEAALRKIGWQDSSILAAGRTDAGVHATGQVISFKLDWQHSVEDLRNAMNYQLPPEIAARQVMQAPEGFHPRFDAISRRYRYHLFCDQVRNPLQETYAWRIWPPVDLDQMNRAAASLMGVHDFKAFGRPMTQDGSTIRELFSARWQLSDDDVYLDIRANAFLYHMVRRIVLALVRIGQATVPVGLISESLESGELPLSGLAPAEGLVLEEVYY
jgi:tRNA pseudouridine38-40 synthase